MSQQSALKLKLGCGGVVGTKLMTFDYLLAQNRIKPYLWVVEGRCFEYKFKTRFIKPVNQSRFPKLIHGKGAISLIFDLEPFLVYRYKNFMGDSYGEVLDGFFALTRTQIVELEEEAVFAFVDSRTREKLARRDEPNKIYLKPGQDPDDVPF